MYAWLAHTLINVQGLFIIYACLWMLIDYEYTGVERRPAKLAVYEVLYGVLMLGKAQYNILASSVVYVMLFDGGRWKEVAALCFYQAISLALWAFLLLPFIFHGTYGNYELSRDGYSLASYHKGVIDGAGPAQWFQVMILDSFQRGIDLMRIGLGWPVMISATLAIGFWFGSPLGWLMLVYFLVTSIFLNVVNFSLPRHAGDFAPLGFLGAAFAFDWLRRRVAGLCFWPVFGVVMCIWEGLNTTPYFIEPSISKGYSSGPGYVLPDNALTRAFPHWFK